MSLARAFTGSPATRQPFGGALWLAGGVGLVAASALAARLPDEQTGPLVMARHLSAVGLTLGLLWLGTALGLRLLRALSLSTRVDLETGVFAVGLGLGGVAYLVLAGGLLGLLQPITLGGLLALTAFVLHAELLAVARAIPSLLDGLRRQRAALRRRRLLFFALPLIELSLILLTIRTLAPTNGYDALLYHLAGPRELLRLGRIVPLPELMQANMPFTVNLLYLLGLAAGSDELSNLLHLAFAGLTALAVFSFGRRFFVERVGWVAALVFLSAPALAVYGPIANVDFGWAFFDFLAVYGFALWARTERRSWLIAAGLAAGLSLGSKYLGAITFGALGLAVIWRVIATIGLRPGVLLSSTLTYGLPAAIVAAPWYLKNWLWLGSPLWPFLAGGAVDTGGYFASHMNTGRDPVSYLLLPLRLYVGGTVELPAAIPPLALLAVPGYVLVRRQRTATALLALAGLHFVIWSQGIQTMRYLFPIFPALSLVAAYVLSRATVGRPQLAGAAASGLVVLSAAIGLGASIVSFGLQQSLPQLVGFESREAYLRRSVHDYAAIAYLNDRPEQVGRVLVIGDARLYHHRAPVIVDQTLEVAAALMPLDQPAEALARLRAAGVTHVFVSQGHLSWLAQFDPERRVTNWWTAFQATAPAFLIPEFSHDVATVYRVADAVAERSRP